MAKKLKEMLKEKHNECELIAIAGLINQDSIEATSEKVGFVFPVYEWALPQIVCDFIEKIDLSNTKYLFSLSTMGGFSRQYVIQKLNSLLKPKNKKLDASSIIKVFSNYIMAGYNPLPSKEKQKMSVKKAELKLNKFAELIRNNKQGKGKRFTFMPSMKHSYEKAMEVINTEDENYYVDDKCNGCGICQKICPVNNIKIVDKKPEWQHKCQKCLGCLHYCPQAAIQYGEYTPTRDRFNHPNVTLKELINQNKEIETTTQMEMK